MLEAVDLAGIRIRLGFFYLNLNLPCRRLVLLLNTFILIPKLTSTAIIVPSLTSSKLFLTLDLDHAMGIMVPKRPFLIESGLQLLRVTWKNKPKINKIGIFSSFKVYASSKA